MNGIEAAQQNAERDAQARERRQRYIDYSLKRLRPKYLQRRAQEYLMENPNAMWNDFKNPNSTKRRVFSSYLQILQRRRTEQSLNGYTGTEKKSYDQNYRSIELMP